jgi:hypothetical protein
MTEKQKEFVFIGAFIGLVLGLLFIIPYLKGGKNENLIQPAKTVADSLTLIQDAILQ